MKQYQADFSLNRKQSSVLFYVICVQYTRFLPEFRSHCLHKLSIRLVRKVYIWLSWSVWEFQKLCLWQHVSTSSCMLRIEKLITFNMTCTWTFHNSLLRLIVVITFIILMNCTPKTLLHVISISVIMFAPYCYLQTISCQCDYELKQVQTVSLL